MLLQDIGRLVPTAQGATGNKKGRQQMATVRS